MNSKKSIFEFSMHGSAGHLLKLLYQLRRATISDLVMHSVSTDIKEVEKEMDILFLEGLVKKLKGYYEITIRGDDHIKANIKKC